FCEIENPTVADLSASGTGILWYASETSITPLATTDPLIDGTAYWASQTEPISGCESASRLVVNVSIISPPPPTTTVTNQVFCEINNPTVADLNAAGTGILWYATETSTTALNTTDPLVDSTSYWASQTEVSGCESANRLVVNVTVITPAPPITINQNKTFCEIENATVANLNDPDEVLLWYATETSTTPLNTTDLLVDGEDYWATQTISGTGCEIANRLKVTVSITITPPPTTLQNNQTFCEIDNAKIGDLIVTGNGILWYATETSATALNLADLLANGTYWATQTDPISGCESASRLAVTVVINTTPPPTTALANQSFCIKDYLPNAPIISDLSASGTNLLWYATETSVTPLNSADLLSNGSYWATQTDASTGCESALRLVVNVSVINPETPTTTAVNQTFCATDKPTIASLQVNGTSIIWYTDQTALTPLNSTDLVVNGTSYWAAASDASTGCESVARLMVTVSITDVAPATIDNVSQTFCESDFPTIANLAVTGNGVIWYASETETTPLANTSLLIDGMSYWAVQTNTTTGCESSVRVVVNVSLTSIATPTLISLGNEFCKIDNPTIADLNLNVSANNGGTITWYDAFPNGNLLNTSVALTEGETYYAIETDVNGCKSINPLKVTVTLEACDEYDVVIYDGFSPSGNGVNDTFKITNLRELYPNFKVEFFNRWGNLIYTASAAKDDWNGRLNGDGELSAAGVYYFVIYFNKNDRKPIQRRLYLSR
ncbi:MAG: gliding motility-associated C-terminal domain-containing protein, partial [Lutibacter sp.]|nr:gliding motility-associated C-terminal domain-containing protein [Lutibacter sp.]